MNTFDPFDQAPYDEEASEAQAEAILEHLPTGASVIDLGCGIGRVARRICEQVGIIGIDRDPNVLAAFEKATGSESRLLDFATDPDGLPDGLFDAVLFLGNTMMEIVDPMVAQGVFQAIGGRLKPGGFLAIDDFPITLWEELTEGNWGTGMDDEQSMQMIWEPGEPVFVLRRDDEVDTECWVPRASDRRFRLWSLGELRLLGSAAGLDGPTPLSGGGLLVMKHI